MINYLKNMKIKYPNVTQEKRSSMDSAEAGCKWNYRIGKKTFPYSNCLIIALPVASFLALGIYFILVDLKILASVLNTTTTNETTWSEDANPSHNGDEVLIVFEEENNTEFVLQTEERRTTTERGFVYSPTVPHVIKQEESPEVTHAHESSEGANCFSTRIDFCEGVLPYDLVMLPEILNVSDRGDLEPFIHTFRRLIDANCSARARDLACGILEPECRQGPGSQVCGENCRVVADECRNVIAGDEVLSEVFDCQRHTNWDGTAECIDLFAGRCLADEFQCPGGECIPRRWVCDGRENCRDGFDEGNCSHCPEGFFRCVKDGMCIPMTATCDGVINCRDASDEASC